MRVRFASVGGIPTRWYEAGSGAPVLLLHGAGVSSDTWLRNLDALAEDFAVYAPDTLGHGFTGLGDYVSGPPHAPTIEHLAAFVDHLGLGRLAAVGSSFGALLAALLYFRLPERVERLVLNSSGSVVNDEATSAQGLRRAYENGLSAVKDPTAENCRRRLARIFHDPAKVPDELVLMQMTLYALPGAREAFERRLTGMMDLEASRPFRLEHRLEEIAVPTLMVWGREDPRAAYDRAVAAAGRIRKARLVAFEGCGHHPHIEHPDRWNALARRFLKGELDDAPVTA